MQLLGNSRRKRRCAFLLSFGLLTLSMAVFGWGLQCKLSLYQEKGSTGAVAKTATIAVSFAHAVGAEIDVLNVIEDGAAGHAEKLGEIKSHLYDALDAVVPEAARAFCHPQTFIEAGHAQEQILQHIRKRSMNLLVLGI